MNKLTRCFAVMVAGGAALPGGLSPASAAAAESRTWLSTSGTTIEAELVRVAFDSVELHDKDGRVLRIPRSQLSFGDNDFLNETALQPKAGAIGSKPAAKLPNPALEMKVDTAAFKLKAGDFKMVNRSWQVCETPHFKVMYQSPGHPADVGELAERLWFDTAFFHRSFRPKWQGRKMGILLASDETAYDEAGDWYAGMLTDAGDKESADRVRKTWRESATGTIELPRAEADNHGIFSGLRIYRAYQRSKMPRGKPQPLKGVWDAFRTHTLVAASPMARLSKWHGLSG